MEAGATEGKTTKRPEPAHRVDIDYLRALAVLAVVGFHFGIPGLSGGFVGVDVFFVISGYLIGSHVVAEARAGTFSFARFYERRIRRILPALYVMMAVVGIGGWFLLRPAVYSDFFRSLTSTVLFSSNVFFWNEVGYFDAVPGDKVLLHTWSLAVEEQFYLVFPPIIIFIHALRVRFMQAGIPRILGILAVCGAALCLASEWAVIHAPMAAFYLTPCRAWEFLMGTSLVWTGQWRPTRPGVRWLTTAIGLALMLGAIMLYNDALPFPGLSALVPCTGAAIYLHAGGAGAGSDRNTRLVMVPAFLGKISYSLYLWHWPVLILGLRLVAPGERGSFFVTSMLAVLLIVATLSYLLVEKPIQQRLILASRRKLIIGSLLSSAILLGAGLMGGFTNWLPARIMNSAEFIEYSRTNIGPFYRTGTCFLKPDQPFSDYRKDLCLESDPEKINILLVGDSIAAHYFYGLKAELSNAKFNIMQMTVSTCAPFFGLKQPAVRACDGMVAELQSLVKSHPPDILVVSSNWRTPAQALGANPIAPDDTRAISTGSTNEFEWSLRVFLAELMRDGVPTILFGPSAEFTEPLPAILQRQGSAKAVDQKLALRGDLLAIDQDMRRIAAGYKNVTFVSILDALCPKMNCPLETDSGAPLTWDRIHLTPDGSLLAARILVPRMNDALLKKQRGQ